MSLQQSTPTLAYALTTFEAVEQKSLLHCLLTKWSHQPQKAYWGYRIKGSEKLIPRIKKKIP